MENYNNHIKNMNSFARFLSFDSPIQKIEWPLAKLAPVKNNRCNLKIGLASVNNVTVWTDGFPKWRRLA